ncbi:hypothetical protein INT48_004824 [Thamnidium elegans]|uniref:Glycosyltransferase n=1 Tax=Thamnidium elegans TaxID=101142 RepID=A0A8H7SK63_9FUNG|nr:hypothetical protein INT48_004824 [Thamnidium elegans]
MSTRTTEPRLHGSLFHQRKPSLTTICPSPDKRPEKRRNSSQYTIIRTNSYKTTWLTKIFDMPVIKLVGWTYIIICFCLSTIHLISSFSLLDPNGVRGPKIDWDKILLEKHQSWSTLEEISPEMRSSKMFSKSAANNDFIRPYWFTASIKPSKDALTLNTVLTLKDWDYLIQLAELYEGPISAALLLPSTQNLNNEISIQQLTDIRNDYETTVALRRHVDIHLILQPGGLTEEGATIATGSYQESRNLARLFSRTEFVALVPVATLWMTDIMDSIKKYHDILRSGDLLILPTFGFPNYEGVETDLWPIDKQSIIEWVEEGQLGLLDYNYELNNGPSSYGTWKDAKDPYLVPTYDFNYGPIFISTRLNHPWCEERFEDHVPSCIYTKYLAGAKLWVMPNDYAIRTGQEPSDTLESLQQKRNQNKIARKYRIEQCVFYARQFDQYGIFDTEKADHVKQECSLALLKVLSNQ